MKMFPIISLLLITSSTVSFSQTRSGATGKNARIEQEIRKLEREWFDSYVKGDRAAFDRIVADDAMITYGNGQVGDKSQAIAEIKAPADSSYSLTSDDVKVRVYGDTAIVTGRVIEKGIFNGRSLDSQSRYTDVWVRRGGRWQVVAAQNTRLPQARPAERPKVDSNLYNDYVGKYEVAPNLTITILRDGDKIISEVGDRRSELVAESDTVFTIPEASIRITFVKDTNGRVTHLTLNEKGREGQARRIQ